MKKTLKFIGYTFLTLLVMGWIVEAFDTRTPEEKRDNETARRGECKWELKRSLKDPDSLQIIETLDVPLEKGGRRVIIKYRAKNSFGGYVVEVKSCDFPPVKTAQK